MCQEVDKYSEEHLAFRPFGISLTIIPHVVQKAIAARRDAQRTDDLGPHLTTLASEKMHTSRYDPWYGLKRCHRRVTVSTRSPLNPYLLSYPSACEWQAPALMR